MIIPDAKKTATVILSKMKGDGTSAEQDVKPEVELNEGDEGLKSAAEDILQAISDKSPHALMSGLRAFLDMCDTDDSEPQGPGSLP